MAAKISDLTAFCASGMINSKDDCGKDVRTNEKNEDSCSTSAFDMQLSQSQTEKQRQDQPQQHPLQKDQQLEQPRLSHEDRHLIWRKNAPFFYGALLSQRFEWPTTTIEFLPSTNNIRVLLGFTTDGSDYNSLVIAEARMPNPNILVDDPLSAENYVGFRLKNRQVNPRYSNMSSYMEIKAIIPHPGRNITRVRACPRNHLFMATCTIDGYVLFFDFCRHQSFPTGYNTNSNTYNGSKAIVSKPQLILQNSCSKSGSTEATAAVESISWTHSDDSFLVGVSADGLVQLWDFNGPSSIQNDGGVSRYGNGGVELVSTPILRPVSKFQHRSNISSTDNLNDVRFHPQERSLAAIAAEDGNVLLHDWRHDRSTQQKINVDPSGCNCVDWSYHESHIFSTGCTGGNIYVYDIRNTGKYLLQYRYHQDSVNTVKFNPTYSHILASASADSTVALWDLSSTDELDLNIRNNNETHLSKGLFFVHEGHSNQVCDFSWASELPMAPLGVSDSPESAELNQKLQQLRNITLGGSTGYDNKLQLWRPSENVLTGSPSKYLT